MKKILLDTNALMAITQFHLDVFSELNKTCNFPFTVAILQATIDELQRISGGEGKSSRAAKFALALVKTRKVAILPVVGNVDDLLTAYSHKGDVVLTQDVELKRLLTKPYLTIRQKKKIVIVT